MQTIKTTLVYCLSKLAALFMFVRNFVNSKVEYVVAKAMTWAMTDDGYETDSKAARFVGTVSRVSAAVLTPMVLFLTVAAALAFVSPPPTKVTYNDIAIREDATWFSRNAAWVTLNTGLVDAKVSNRLVYTKAKIGDSTLIGLPGFGKWFLISRSAYSVL